MKTIEMEIELMGYFGVRRKLIVPNVYWGVDRLNYECDLVVLTNSGYATEIEIKISKSDLLKDKEKKHKHQSNLFKYFYFAVPEKLKDIAIAEIPERAGLLLVINSKQITKYGKEYTTERYVKKIKKPMLNKNAHKWTKEERYNLARLGCMRIKGLKEKIANCT